MMAKEALVAVLLSALISFWISFLLGFKTKRYLSLIFCVLLSGAIGFFLVLAIYLYKPPASSPDGFPYVFFNPYGLLEAIGFYINLIVTIISSSIFGLIGGILGVFKSKRGQKK